MRSRNIKCVFHFQLNYTTILYLTSKELNKEPLDHLQRLLNNSSAANDGAGDDKKKVHEFLHAKLFGNRDDVTQLLNDECKLNEINTDFLTAFESY